jgi:N utilization substance protein B
MFYKPIGARREGREAAVQFLYQQDLNPDITVLNLPEFYTLRGLSPSARRFSEILIRGASYYRDCIDNMIQSHTKNYRLMRISSVDRNILRIAIYEMLERPEIPSVVSINEAIEIAKKYSTEESGRFVNGVLDKVRLVLN